MTTNNQRFCEHVQLGQMRIYQRVDVSGLEIFQCWKCATNTNAILGKAEDILNRLTDIVERKPEGESKVTPPWSTSVVEVNK